MQHSRNKVTFNGSLIFFLVVLVIFICCDLLAIYSAFCTQADLSAYHRNGYVDVDATVHYLGTYTKRKSSGGDNTIYEYDIGLTYEYNDEVYTIPYYGVVKKLDVSTITILVDKDDPDIWEVRPDVQYVYLCVGIISCPTVVFLVLSIAKFVSMLRHKGEDADVSE